MNDHDYELNMPKDARLRLAHAFDHEGWTWLGLAEWLKRRATEGDIEELVYLLTEDDDEPA